MAYRTLLAIVAFAGVSAFTPAEAAVPVHLRRTEVLETSDLDAGVPVALPGGIAFDPARRTLALIANSGTQLVRLDAERAPLSVATLGAAAHGSLSTYEPSTRSYVWLDAAASEIVVVDTDADGDPLSSVRRTRIPLAETIRAVGLAAGGQGDLYVLDELGHRILVIPASLWNGGGTGAIGSIPLGDLGQGAVNGLAYDPAADRFYTLLLPNRVVAEFGDDGQLLRSFDVERHALVEPAGMTLAPSSDPNDAETDLSVWVVDRRRRNVEGRSALVEIDLSAAVGSSFESMSSSPELPTTNVDIGSSMFTSVEGSTGEKPQSKVWYTGGNYWCIVQGPSGVAFYRRVGTAWNIATFANAVLRPVGQADVKWNETTQQLFVLVYTLGGTAQLYKYNYTHATLTYALVAGFPITLTNPSGSETMVLEQDSTGRLWTTVCGTTTVLVYYSTSADHLTWTTTPVTLETGVIDDDISTIIAFGGNKIGVAWSDQSARWRFGFRWRNDTDPPTTWQALEVIHAATNQTDDHINIAADGTGRLYMIGKDVANDHRVFRRAAAGGWTNMGSAVGPEGTRGIIQVAEADNLVYIYYVRWLVTPERIQRRSAPIGGSPLVFGSQVDFLQSSFDMNNPSGMKQLVPAGNTICLGSEYQTGTTVRAWWNGVGSPPAGGGPTAPNAPTNLAATLLTGPVRVSLAWQAPVGGSAVSSYNVYRQTSGGAFVKINVSAVTALTFTDNSPGTAAVCYQVTAVGSTGLESVVSNTSCTDTRAAGPPQSATATLLTGPVRTSVAWQVPAVGVASGYNVYRSVDGGAFVQLNVGAVTALSYVDNSPPTGQLCYHVTAIAVTTGAESAASNAPCVDTRLPGTPLNLYAAMVIREPSEAAIDLPFNEGTGQVAGDVSGNNLSARLGTGTGADAADPSWVAGHAGNALQFDGTADFIEVPDSPFLDSPGSFTWEAWVKRTTTSSQGCIVNKGQTDEQTIRITVSSAGALTFRWENTSATRFEISASAAIANTNWNHVAFVYDQAASQSRIYVNGVLRTTGTGTGSPNVSAEAMHIGARLSGSSMTNFFGGAIDDFRLFHEVRYNANFTPGAAPVSRDFGLEPASGATSPVSYGSLRTTGTDEASILPLGAGDGRTFVITAIGDTTVHLGWQPPPSGGTPAGYKVFRSFNGGAFTQVGPSTVNDTTFTDSLSSLGLRCYHVTAVNAIGGEGTASNEACAAFGLPPAVVAPETASGAEGSLLTFVVTVTDLDGEPISSLTPNLTGLPSGHGATFTVSADNDSGTFAWTPDFTHAGGPYLVTFTGANSLSSVDSTLITIDDTDRAPVVVSPVSVTAAEEQLLEFVVVASDPDGDLLTSLTADLSSLPGSPTFTATADNDSGTVQWTPPLGGVTGPYTVTFAVANTLTGDDTTTIVIDFPPVVTAPASPSGAENSPIAFTVTATDAEPITSLEALDLPPGATFTPNGTNTSGDFAWTPGFDASPGPYVVRFVATNALADTASSSITVDNTDRAPEVTATANPSVAETATLAFTVTVSDPDGDAILSLDALDLPPGATFTPNGTNTAGDFSWTPGFDAAPGPYVVRFVAANALADTAASSITVTNTDRAPEVTASASESTNEGQLLAFTVTAADPDGDEIATLEALDLPPGATFTPNGTQTSGELSWTPDFSAAPGPYVVHFRAANALADTGATSIAVVQVDVAPVVTAPASPSVQEGLELAFTVTAADFDGDTIATLIAVDLPPGASFAPNGSNTSGQFSWTPDFDDAPGSYPVTFIATNALADTTVTTITVTNTDRAPAVTPSTGPKSPSVLETETLTFTVDAVDDDGDGISSLTALDLPPGATFTPNGTFTSAEFSWTPGYDAAPGPYVVRFVATNTLADTALTVISVVDLDRAPIVTATASETVSENELLTFAVTASDPDGDPITSLSVLNLPAGATFSPDDASNTSGTFSWTPGYHQGGFGAYGMHFVAANALADSAFTEITVLHVNRPPVVAAPPTPSVLETENLSFSVTVSHPDGDPIADLFVIDLPSGASFISDGPKNLSASFSWTPDYDAAPGPYVVRFGATGLNGLSDTTVTTITVINNDRAPSISGPANETATEGQLLTFLVGSSDDDNDPITLTALDLPPGATFTPIAAARSVGMNAGPSGEFAWTPGFTSAPGPYVVRFVATANGAADTTATTIAVTNVDVAPVVVAPPSRSAPEGITTTITVTASDFDGDAFTSLVALDLPSGATFTPNGSNTSGDLVWTPAFGTPAGPYLVTFIATANGASDTAYTSITVTDVDRAPVVTATASENVAEGQTLAFTVTAVDPDGESITSLTATGLPPGASFVANGTNSAGDFTYTPGFSVAPASFTVTFIAANALADTTTTSVTVTNTDRAPVVTSPASLSVAEGDLVQFTVTASDADGDAITSLSSPNLPAGATFTPNGPKTSGQFSWTVGFDQTGVYDVRFVAANALSGADTTHIDVANTDRAPIVVAPANRNATENTLHGFEVTASDPDLDGITSLVAVGLPDGATFTPNGTNTSGEFEWTPGFDTAPGPYLVRFIATNALADTAETSILVGDIDRAPIVTAPANEDATEGQLLTFIVSSTDPDGTPDPTLTALDLPPGATFTALAARSVGTNGGPSAEFAWTPGFAAAPGPYVVRFVATNALADTTSTTITVAQVDVAPVVTAPATRTAPEGVVTSFSVTASDFDNDAITTLAAIDLPPGATFVPNGSNTSGQFSWTPAFGLAPGVYEVRFHAVANGLADTATTTVTVTDVDRAPDVVASATQTVLENETLTFTVTASDPDGQPISSLTMLSPPAGATFTANGDNSSGEFSWTPGFTAAPGPYVVRFRAANALADTATTSITVTNVDRAPVVTAPASHSIAENSNLSFNVTVADADNDAITTLVAVGLPSGASFTPNGPKTSGTFSWTPSFTQEGPFTIVFVATNALEGRDTTEVTVTNTDRAPVVVATPSSTTVVEGTPVTVDVTASDPDGEAITSLTADLTGFPAGATYTPSGTTSGQLTWTPGAGDVRPAPYVATFTAENALTGTATSSITVNSNVVNLAPNFSFETNTASWNITGGGALTRVAGGHHGSWSAQLAGPSGTGAFGLNDSPSFLTNLTQGTRYRFQVWVRSVAHTGLARIRIREYTDDGDQEASFYSTGVNLTPTWQLLSVDHVIQSNGNYIDFQVLDKPNVSFERFLVDDIQVFVVPTITAPPTVTAPASISIAEGQLLTINVTANDPDGPITNLTANTGALPAGNAPNFTKNGSNTTGQLTWTPDFDDAGGPYAVTFTASNAQSGSATTMVTVTDAVDQAPVVTAPETRTVAEGANLTFTVTASDANGQAIATFAATGMPAGATFNTNGAKTSGTFNWTPGFAAAGDYDVIFTATNTLSGVDTTRITVTNVDRAPVVVATPATVTVLEGQQATVNVTATDPDGDAINTLSLITTGLPGVTNAQFNVNGTNTAGTFTWTPTASDGRPQAWLAIFQATNLLTGRDTTAVTVNEPISNLVGNPSFESNLNGWINYNSTLVRVAGGRSPGSFCLEVRGPSSIASFGVDDQPDWVPTVAGVGAVYRIQASVRSAVHRGKTRIRVYEYAGNTQIGSTFYSNEVTLSPTWQPIVATYTVRQGGTRLSIKITDIAVAGSEIFQVDDVSMELISTGAIMAGAAEEDSLVRMAAAPAPVGGDAIPERFEARIGPNPLSARGHLTLALPQAASVRGELYDPMGRRVRVLVDGISLAAGRHVIPVDPAGGTRMQPGVYLWRIQAGSDVKTGRIVIAP